MPTIEASLARLLQILEETPRIQSILSHYCLRDLQPVVFREYASLFFVNLSFDMMDFEQVKSGTGLLVAVAVVL